MRESLLLKMRRVVEAFETPRVITMLLILPWRERGRERGGEIDRKTMGSCL